MSSKDASAANGMTVVLIIISLSLPASVSAARSTQTPSPPPRVSYLDDPSLLANVLLFYQTNGGVPIWIERRRALPALGTVFELFDEAVTHGLDPARYGVAALRDRAASLGNATAPIEIIAEFDVAVTAALLAYIDDIMPAARKTRSIRADRDGRALSADLARSILASVRDGGLGDTLRGLAPRHRQYQRLRATLRDYETIRFGGGWLRIGPGPALRLGDRDPRVARLRSRLSESAEIRLAPGSDAFDPELERLVLEYQRVHGLDPDGTVGQATLRHLDTDIDTRIAQIDLNLARWRRMPRSLGAEYIFVNIPEYRLSLVRGGEERLAMRVIVGDKKNPTPEFSDEIEYLVFNPYWHVPRNIAVTELLPEIQRDTSYLARMSYEIVAASETVASESIDWQQLDAVNFPYRLRQAPGPHNALGRLKFMLPNPYRVYLHDTPGQHLFARARRAFSHGCVRLEDPEALAAALLGVDPEWSRARLSAQFQNPGETRIVLKRPVPVHIGYFSVTVDGGGKTAFLEDVYGRDRASLQPYLTRPPWSIAKHGPLRLASSD